MKKILIFLAIGLPLTYFTHGKIMNNKLVKKEIPAMQIASPSFLANQKIPSKFTCQGIDISPELQWRDAPIGTKSFTLICDDPDAPSKTWVHWVVYNLPYNVAHLSEGADIKSLGGKLGKNDFGKQAYGGPCPPQGHGIHHYHFKLYALNIKLDLAFGASKEEVMRSMQGNVLAKAELVGLYER